MPTLRSSKRLESEERRCLQEMRDEGISIPGCSVESESSLNVSVIGGLETLIFNLPTGLAGYCIWLRIVAGKSGRIFLEECEIITEFDDQIVLECFDLGGPNCQVGQCSYPKSEVLNDRFPLRLRGRGDLIVGVILATGLKPIPAEFLQGMRVPFTLNLSDQFWNKTSVNSTLSVDRSTTPRKRLGRPVSSIFDSLEIAETAIRFGEISGWSQSSATRPRSPKWFDHSR